MKNFATARTTCALVTGAALVFSFGCGWSSRQSRSNTQSGISESGYPGHGAADPGSPALESMHREEKKGISENAPKGEAGGPGAKTTETHAPGQTKTDKN